MLTGGVICEDLKAFKIHKGKESWSDLYAFLRFMVRIPEYRNVFYMRLPRLLRVLLGYVPRRATLHIFTKSRDIGGGFYVGHGWSTVVNAKKIGRYCVVGQNVTIGSRNIKEPTIGDHVSVWAHAVVLGDITIGDNTQIGSGAVVVKSVPANCVVVPAKSMIIRQDGERCVKLL